MKKLIAAHILIFSLFAPAYVASAQQQKASPNEVVSQGFSDIESKSGFCNEGTCTYIPLEPLPIPGYSNCYGVRATDNCANPVNFANLIGSSFRLLIGAGAVIAVIMIVLGALTYMFSDIAGNKKSALNRIRGAMWAVVLLVSSYLILVTINPELVKFNLSLKATSNFQQFSDPVGTAAAQPTQAQAQAAINQCAGGKTARQDPSGTLVCQ